jgi:hypothetical protein
MFDSVTQRFGTGTVDVLMTVSEELGVIPFLTLTPQGGGAIPITLISEGENLYAGSFTIASTTSSGLARATLSARDVAGNRGSVIDQGETLVIDTKGPDVVQLTLQPSNVIKNDPVQPSSLTVAVRLDEKVRPGSSPQFTYNLSNTAFTPVSIETVQAGSDAFSWNLSLTLPSTAGQTTEFLEFQYRAEDDFGNVSTKIVPPHRFEIYQGDLPGLDSPLGLTAKSLSRGRIELKWQHVDQAVGYQLFRRLIGEQNDSPIGDVLNALEYTDLPESDGTYQYAVASVRQEAGENSLSELSNTVTAVSDRTPPIAPFDLTMNPGSTGARADWKAPLGANESLTYSLFRSVQPITTFEGLLPIKSNIGSLLAIDPVPNDNQTYYAVASVDSVGNLSSPSNPAQFVVPVLPVSSLFVTQVGGQIPIVSWSPPSGAIAGYNLFLLQAGQSQGLNQQGLLQTTSFPDQGYSGDERRYSLVAVGLLGQNSLSRELLLPKVEISLPDDSKVVRGFMNRLFFGVKNISTDPLINSQLVVTLGGIEHRSSVVSVPGNGEVTLPVVVGGYDTLPLGIIALGVRLESHPHEGEGVFLTRSLNLPVEEGQMVVSLLHQDFIRGGTGKVQFTLQNTSNEEVEVITARGRGTSPSPDIRFILVDIDGNEISRATLHAAQGPDLVTLASGDTLLRIPVGFEATPGETEIQIPSNAPDQVFIKLEIDHIYFHHTSFDEVILKGLQTRSEVRLIDTSYLAEVLQITPSESNGDQDVVIAGKATFRTSLQSAPQVPVVLKILNNGYERTERLLTDAQGNFTYAFRPLVNELGGIYSVWAIHPDLRDRNVQKTFVVRRVSVSPSSIEAQFVRNYPLPMNLQVSTGAGTVSRNVRIAYLAEDQANGIFLLL